MADDRCTMSNIEAQSEQVCASIQYRGLFLEVKWHTRRREDAEVNLPFQSTEFGYPLVVILAKARTQGCSAP